MASHDISIKITADASGVNKAVSSTNAALNQLKSTRVGGTPFNGLQSAANRATSSINQTSTAAKALESTLGTLKGVVAGAFAIGSIKSFASAALEASANAEVLRKGLTFQLGADQADLLISKMKEIGETSAYDGSALIPMARLWINVGDNAETAIGKMNKIVDAGSAYGLTQEQIQNCTLALTQMAGAGKIDAGNMNQLTNDGIPAWQLLADAMGMPVEQLRDMASKGQLTGDALNSLWDGLTAKTEGASAEMQGTLMSHFTNLEESAQNSLAGIGDIISKAFDVSGILETAGEYVDQFKEHIASINDAIANGGNPMQAIVNEISAVSPVIGAVANTVLAAFNSIKAVIIENQNAIKNIVTAVVAFGATYMLITKIVAAFTAVRTAITVATVAMRLFGVAAKAALLFTSLNPVILGIAAVAAVIALAVMHWDELKAAASSAATAIGNAMTTAGTYISAAFEAIATVASGIWDGIVAAATAAAEWIGNAFTTAVTTISTMFTEIATAATAVWDSVVAYITTVVTQIQAVFAAVAEWFVTNVWTPVSNSAIDRFNAVVGLCAVVAAQLYAVWQAVAEWLTATVWTPISTAASEAWTAIVAACSAAYAQVMAVWQAIVSWFTSTIVDPIKEAFELVWQNAVESAEVAVSDIQSAWESVTAFFSALWDSITETASAAWAVVVSVATSAYESAVSAWNAAVAFFSALWESISSAASAAWAAIVAWITQAWANVQAAWGAAVGWFQGSVWGPISSAVTTVETAITSAFQSAYSAVTGIFGGLASWFESNVIGPIREKFNTLRSIGSSITGLAGSGGGGGGGGEAEAKGGINGGPMRLARGGLVGIPALANGGQLKHGTPAIVGEAGPEAVIPLRDNILSKIGSGIMAAYNKGKSGGSKVSDIQLKIQSELKTSELSAYSKVLQDAAEKARSIGEELQKFHDYETKANEEAEKYSATGQETLDYQDKIAQTQQKIADLQAKISAGDTSSDSQLKLKKYQDELTEAKATYEKKKAAAIKAAQEVADNKQAIEQEAADGIAQLQTQAINKVFAHETAIEEAKRQMKKASNAEDLADFTAIMAQKDAITGQSYAEELANEESLNTQRQAWQDQMMLNAVSWGTYMQTTLTDLATNLQSGLASGLADCIVKGKDLAASLGSLAQSLLTTLIKNVMEKWIAQWGIIRTLSSATNKEAVTQAHTAAAAERVKSGVLAANATAAFIAANPWMAWGAAGIVSGQMAVAKTAAMAFSTGGAVHGAGSSTSDSIPTMLSDGEYVINADAVSKLGLPALNTINSGNLPHYADGGEVGTLAAGQSGSTPTNLTLNVSALDASSFNDFLRNGGGDSIKQMLFDSNRDFTSDSGVW